MKGGDEYDGLSKNSRKFYMWSKGQLKKIKRGYNKRFRKEGKKLEDQMFNAVKEIIWHLTCTSCNNWFTYATMEEKLRIERYSFHCPHCGIKGSARINNEKED